MSAFEARPSEAIVAIHPRQHLVKSRIVMAAAGEERCWCWWRRDDDVALLHGFRHIGRFAPWDSM